MPKPAPGTIVKANFGAGEEYALFVEADDDGKDTLVALGKGDKVGYREPQDRDEHGSGRTWWTA